MSGWRQTGGIFRGGDFGGDIQVTDAYSLRYVHADRPAVVDVYFYGVELDGDRGFRVQTQTVRTVCKDVRDPGGTEVWCHATYVDGQQKYQTVAEAGHAALAAANRHRPAEITWDGLAPRERR